MTTDAVAKRSVAKFGPNQTVFFLEIILKRDGINRFIK